MKTCSICIKVQPLTEFTKNKNSPDGLMRQCKGCNKNRATAWQLANPDKLKAYNKDRTIKRHGLTQTEYDDMLDKQNGLCAICMEVPPTVIDHDHKCCSTTYSCGKCIRGLLCSNCNTAIGLFKEEPKRILNALTYLGD